MNVQLSTEPGKGYTPDFHLIKESDVNWALFGSTFMLILGGASDNPVGGDEPIGCVVGEMDCFTAARR